MPTAFPYFRISTSDQTVAQQRLIVTPYYEFALKPKGFALGQEFPDEGVSGDVPFLSRPAGHKCSVAAQPGDVVIVLKLDRAFRNTKDCLATVDTLGARGVTFHLLDLPAQDLGTAVGRLCLTMVAAFAEFERNRMSERMKEFFRARRARGIKQRGPAPWGFKYIRSTSNSHKWRLVPNPQQREVGALYVHLRDDKQFSWNQIYWHVQALCVAQKVALPPWCQSHCGIQNAYKQETALRAKETEAAAKARLDLTW